MKNFPAFPFFPVEFTKEGQVYQQAEVDRLLDHLRQAGAAGVTDLLVISHGWNNDKAEAERKYECLMEKMSKYLPADRRFAVLGVFWPSKKFAEQDLTPGGGASVDSPITAADLQAELANLVDAFDAADGPQRVAQAMELVPELEDSPAAQCTFSALMRGLVDRGEDSADVDGTQLVEALPDEERLAVLAEAGEAVPTDITTGAAGEGQVAVVTDGDDVTGDGQVAGLGDWWGGIKMGAWRLLNFTTYYQMKERAGKVGSTGLREVLRRVRQAHTNLKLHLIGHSFGGRLVTAAASGQSDFQVSSMALLQTAFSHYGLSGGYNQDGEKGFFRPLIEGKTVSGPVLVTHSVRDVAVGRMYPLASRLARQVGSGLGDANDTYGGIGRNGAQKTQEADNGYLLAATKDYQFVPGRILNLNADEVIKSHSDICRDEVASVIMQAVDTT